MDDPLPSVVGTHSMSMEQPSPCCFAVLCCHVGGIPQLQPTVRVSRSCSSRWNMHGCLQELTAGYRHSPATLRRRHTEGMLVYDQLA
jgi:hypothetical protein